MNVLSDFMIRVQQQYPNSIENEELGALLTTRQNQGIEIQKLEEKLVRAKESLAKAKGKESEKVKPKAKKTTSKKADAEKNEG